MEKILLAIGLAALIGSGIYMINQETSNPLVTQTSNPLITQTNPIDHQVITQYQEWKLKYNKKYSSPDLEWYRITVFNDNLITIKNHSLGPKKTYTLDTNQFMDLTPQEFSETYLGLKPSKSSNGKIYEASSDDANLPVDWTTKGVLNEVRNQGQCGSCWAFSTIGAIESTLAIAGKGLSACSEQELVDCSTSYGNQGCNGGLMDFGFQYVIDHGITNRADYPYTARDGKCLKQAADYHISSFQDVASGNCTALESALQKRPISVAVDAERWQFYEKGIFDDCDESLDHGVLLVAFDSKSWTIRNSWAVQWGEEGHIRLAKGNTCGICNSASFPIA